jgi:inorganic triphosphatase YgiF
MNHQLGELASLVRDRAARHPDALAGWLAQQTDVDVERIGADLGYPESRRRLARWLARMGHTEELRRRAEAGDEQARERLVLGPGPG